MSEATISLSHPVLFITDFSNSGVTIPEYSAESTVSATPSCISIRVIADVDGDVTVKLIGEQRSSASSDLVKVFEGPIATPGRKLAVVTPHNERITEIDVVGNVTMTRVSVNEMDFPSEVLVEALR
jgi:hypothetical protein